MLQHAQLVATGNAQVVGEVAGGDLFHHGQGFAQRPGDLAGDDHRGQHTDQQRQQRSGELQGTGLGTFVVTAFELDLVQRVTDLDDGGALYGHLLASDGNIGGGIAELTHGVTVGQHCAFELLDARGFVWHLAVQAGDLGQGAIELAQRQLFGFAADVGDIAAHGQAHLEQLFLGLGDGAELFQAAGVTFRQGEDVAVDRLDQVDGACSGQVHRIARGHAGLVAGAHLVDRNLIRVDGLAQFLEQLDVFRALEAFQQLLLLFAEGIQLDLDSAGSGIVAVGQHVLQAGDTQVGQIAVELGDVAHPVTAVDQPTHAVPAGQGQQAGEQQHQAEAQAEFQVDADVGKPAIHTIPPGMLCFLIHIAGRLLFLKASRSSEQDISAACAGAETLFQQKCSTVVSAYFRGRLRAAADLQEGIRGRGW
ncbi:hypothetical protein D3C80_1002780 [compost metagenome]